MASIWSVPNRSIFFAFVREFIALRMDGIRYKPPIGLQSFGRFLNQIYVGQFDKKLNGSPSIIASYREKIYMYDHICDLSFVLMNITFAKNLSLEYRHFLPNTTQSPLDTCMHRFQLLLELLQCPKRPNHSVNSSSRQQWEKRRIKETNNRLGSQMEGLRILILQQTLWRF